jgi:hypothetical protein
MQDEPTRDLEISKTKNHWPPLTENDYKRNKEVLDEACRIMLDKQNSSPPSGLTAANVDYE